MYISKKNLNGLKHANENFCGRLTVGKAPVPFCPRSSRRAVLANDGE